MSTNNYGEAKGNQYSRPPEQLTHTEAVTLQTLMDIKQSIGEMKSDIKASSEKISGLETKVDKVEGSVSTVTHKIYAAGVVLAIALAIGGFFASKAWDFAISELRSKQVKLTDQGGKENKP